MTMYSGFQAMAAARGDGLLPEFEALLQRAAAPNVVELAQFRAPTAVISGPAPVLPAELPDNVVVLQAKVVAPRAKEIIRRPRASKARNLTRRES